MIFKRKLITLNRLASVDYVKKYETVNLINKCIQLALKEYNTRHDWVGKVIHWELCKRGCTHKSEFILGNEMHQILLDFET